MAAYTENDGFHEIQLNGKQLVFLFMAATVVSVVIFLCGVLVGRGVRAERGDLAQSAENSALPMEVAPVPAASTTQTAANSTVNSAPGQPPTPVDELVNQTGLSAGAVQVLLLELDLGGRIERSGGQLVALRS